MQYQDRIYLDHNSTTELNSELLARLGEVKSFFANPSSQHSSGKMAKKWSEENINEIYKAFHCKPNDFEFLLHSGTSEASNTFLNLGAKDCLFYFASDHSCITQVASLLKTKGRKAIELPLNTDGHFNEDDIISIIQSEKGEGKNWLTFTWVNNETGVVWPLKLARTIKDKTGCSIFVDATQAIGKVPDAFELDTSLDCYSWSSHKFGAFKGSGFSFYKSELTTQPLILGGDQQGLRSGTLNTSGLWSTALALIDIKKSYPYKDILDLKNKIVKLVTANSSFEYIQNESCNTICLIHKSKKADLLLIHFDQHGLDVGSGSACSSGSLTAPKSLVAMGLNEKASRSIRISLAKSNLVQEKELIKRLSKVCEKL
ncbi:MAG: hypothetical protein CME62_03815 [Halobacteriovoraceae bacterium]|nr:hypothetical protein [Halobacteriovoraceae bacterium]|tara:strand:+ start:15236 stop:16351 length:1116 start_codon:yes stop_codon:yes gene_type:complete